MSKYNKLAEEGSEEGMDKDIQGASPQGNLISFLPMSLESNQHHHMLDQVINHTDTSRPQSIASDYSSKIIA